MLYIAGRSENKIFLLSAPGLFASPARVRHKGTLSRWSPDFRSTGKSGGVDQLITTGYFAESGADGRSGTMPTFGRLLIFLFVVAAIVYGGAFWLMEVMDPPSGEIVTRVPHDRFAR